MIAADRDTTERANTIDGFVGVGPIADNIAEANSFVPTAFGGRENGIKRGEVCVNVAKDQISHQWPHFAGAKFIIIQSETPFTMRMLVRLLDVSSADLAKVMQKMGKVVIHKKTQCQRFGWPYAARRFEFARRQISNDVSEITVVCGP